MKTARPKIQTQSDLEALRQCVAEARSQLAAREADCAREQARITTATAALFRRLRELHQKRDRLRLAVDYRQKFLDSFVRDDPDEVEQAEQDLQQAKSRLDAEYEKMAMAADKKIPLTAAQEAGLPSLWQELVKLYQPASFADEPNQRATHHHLATTIHAAKISGEIETLREIAQDPASYLRHKGWAALNFTDGADAAQLNQMLELLRNKIVLAGETLKELRANPDHELYLRAVQDPGVLEEMAMARAKLIELEIVDLEKETEQLAGEIKKLAGKAADL